MMKKLLEGKNAIVTGTARGIGFKTVEVFARHGANVWACARTKTEDFENYCLSLSNQYGVSVEPIYFDLTNKEEMVQAVKLIKNSQRKIDILVNNAGIIKRIPMHEMTRAEFQQVIDIDLVGPFICASAVIPEMMERREGKIINITSMSEIKDRTCLDLW